MVFLEVDGNKVEKELLPGEVIKVDTGNVVGFESSVQYEIEMVKGGMNIFLGGEGAVSHKAYRTGKDHFTDPELRRILRQDPPVHTVP